MVSDANGLSQPDSTPVRPTPEECLTSLNGRSWVQQTGGAIIGVRQSKNGFGWRFYLDFANGTTCFVPSFEVLRSPAKMEEKLSYTARASIVIGDKKVWKLCDVDWIMGLAEDIGITQGSIPAIIQEILSEPEYVYSNGPLSQRAAASIFAEEAKALKYANDGNPHVAAQANDGLYLYYPSLRIIWGRRYPPTPQDLDISEGLYQVGFTALNHPTPCGENPETGKQASLWLWVKPNKEKENVNGHDRNSNQG